jgi:hypothetical protein
MPIAYLDALTHRAGLPVIGFVERGDLYNWQRMTDALAASVLIVQPRASPVYHNMTCGHLLGEIGTFSRCRKLLSTASMRTGRFQLQTPRESCR